MALTHEEDTTQGGQGVDELAKAASSIAKGVDAGKKAARVGADLALGNYGDIPQALSGSTVDPAGALDNLKNHGEKAQNAAKAGKEALKLVKSTGANVAQELITKAVKYMAKRFLKPMLVIAIFVVLIVALLPSWLLAILGLQIGETDLGIDMASEDKKAAFRLFTGDDNDDGDSSNNLTVMGITTTAEVSSVQTDDSDVSGIEDRTGDQPEDDGITDDSFIGAYDEENMFEDSLDEYDRIFNKVAKKARKLSKKEAKKYAKSKGDRWCKVVNEKGKNIVWWTWLYTTKPERNEPINKGDAIIVADIIIRKQKAVEEGIENPDDVEVTTKDIYNFLKDKNHLKGKFYHLTYTNIEEDVVVTKQTGVKWEKAENGYDKPVPVYSEVTEKQKGAYVTVHTYDVYDLFAMGDISPNDIYAYTTTFYDVYLARREQLKTIATPEQYEKLGLANDTPLRKEHDDEISASINAGNIVVDVANCGENGLTVWNSLRQAGFSDVSAAALCGNMQAESHFNTTALSSDGYASVGIAQWTGKRKEDLFTYSAQIGLDPNSIEAQTKYLIEYDLPRRMGQNMEYYKSISDIQEAADYVCKYFETPAYYPSQEAWATGKYNYISWSRFTYSPVDGNYWLDLDARRRHSVEFYEAYHED